MMFAIKHYDNPQCEGEKEFHDDMKRFKYIKRLLRKYKETGVLKERLLLNHIIILNNLFGPEACVTLLLFKIQKEYWETLKSFLLFLNICVPFIPKTLATTSIHKFVNHFGKFEKCSKKIFIFSIAAGSSDQTPYASTNMGNVRIAKTTSSL